MSQEVEVLIVDRTRCDMFGWRLTTVKMLLECGHRIVKVLIGGKLDVHSGDLIECEECEHARCVNLLRDTLLAVAEGRACPIAQKEIEAAPFAGYYSEGFKDTMRKLFPGEKEGVQ